MRAFWKWVLAVAILVIVGFAALVISVESYHRTGPSAQEQRSRESALRPLVQSHASRQQVVRALGLDFEDFSAGSTNRWFLEERKSVPRIHELAERYPGVLFQATSLSMTWLFFDGEGRLQKYYLREQ